jgi:hypothetical protein
MSNRSQCRHLNCWCWEIFEIYTVHMNSLNVVQWLLHVLSALMSSNMALYSKVCLYFQLIQRKAIVSLNTNRRVNLHSLQVRTKFQIITFRLSIILQRIKLSSCLSDTLLSHVGSIPAFLWCLQNVQNTHTHTHIYIYIMLVYIHIYIYIYRPTFFKEIKGLATFVRFYIIRIN